MSNPQGVCLVATCLILAEPFKVVGTSVTSVSCGKRFCSSDGAQEPLRLVWFGLDVSLLFAFVPHSCTIFPEHIFGAHNSEDK